jgi:predicted nuclease of restriction endonuclease-like RecB superfamily
MNSEPSFITFNFEIVLKRKKHYYISTKSLDRIMYGYIEENGVYFPPLRLEFESLVKRYNLVILESKFDGELRLLKRI